jgi:rubrerythrin
LESTKLKKRTAGNVHKAYVEESKAYQKLQVFAENAEKEGFPQIAHLFRAIGASESIHAQRHFSMLPDSVGDTDMNLQRAFHSETGVADLEYQRMLREAHEDGEKTAALMFSQARDVEEGHAKLYKRALDHVVWERSTDYYVCSVCGYLSEGGTPDSCPICGAPGKRFNKIE